MGVQHNRAIAGFAFSGVVEALALAPGKEEDQNGGQGKRHAGNSKTSVDSRAPFSDGSDD